MAWIEGDIEGCIVRPFHKFTDDRGWLAEIFRTDELEEPLHPQMGYISQTDPGVTRGPHEHREQTDLFAFFSGSYTVFLWDDRIGSTTLGNCQVMKVGEANPVVLLIPPGVVHAYRNDGETAALVLNCPNRLYAGRGRVECVDEIRHEDRPDHRYSMD